MNFLQHLWIQGNKYEHKIPFLKCTRATNTFCLIYKKSHYRDPQKFQGTVSRDMKTISEIDFPRHRIFVGIHFSNINGKFNLGLKLVWLNRLSSYKNCRG
jgi:hypothetical protein